MNEELVLQDPFDKKEPRSSVISEATWNLYGSYCIGHDVDTNKPRLEFCGNGDVYVRGELIDNNKEIYEAVRDFFIPFHRGLCSRCAKEIKGESNE